MTFSKTPPSTPGFYAFKDTNGYVALADAYVTEIYKDLAFVMNGRVYTVAEIFGGEWCRLVTAEEITESFHEGAKVSREHIAKDVDTLWKLSRAKRVMEGKE